MQDLLEHKVNLCRIISLKDSSLQFRKFNGRQGSSKMGKMDENRRIYLRMDQKKSLLVINFPSLFTLIRGGESFKTGSEKWKGKNPIHSESIVVKSFKLRWKAQKIKGVEKHTILWMKSYLVGENRCRKTMMKMLIGYYALLLHHIQGGTGELLPWKQQHPRVSTQSFLPQSSRVYSINLHCGWTQKDSKYSISRKPRV